MSRLGAYLCATLSGATLIIAISIVVNFDAPLLVVFACVTSALSLGLSVLWLIITRRKRA